jgi:hypothetical protein
MQLSANAANHLKSDADLSALSVASVFSVLNPRSFDPRTASFQLPHFLLSAFYFPFCVSVPPAFLQKARKNP